MDDESVYRRFFVISDLVKEIFGGTGIRQPTATAPRKPSYIGQPAQEEEAVPEESVPPHLGSTVLQGTRAAPQTPTTSRTRQRTQEASKAAPTERYKFPS